MRTIIDGLDHTLIGVRDLEQARAAYERLGFTMTPRGRHVGWGTANYCAMFPDDYIELLGIVDASQFTNKLDEFLERREGLMGVAFHTSDSQMSKSALDQRGIGAEGPTDLSRVLELPEGDVEPAFKLIFPEAEALPGLTAFICQHLSPELIRRPEWLEHANGATGIAAVTVLVEDPLALEAPYQKIFGSGHVIETDNTLVVRAGRGMVLFCNPDDLSMLHPEARDIVVDSLPMPAAIALTVDNIGRTVSYFEEAGVPHRRMADGTVAVRAGEANGVLLEFREVP